MDAFIKFLKKLFIFFVILFVGDRLLGLGLEKLYFNQKYGQFADISYSVDSVKQKVLIFGSSRAYHHYSTSIISQKLSKSTYNVGMDAQMIPYSSAMQEIILKRYKPEIMILDISPWEIYEGSEKYEKLTALLPYVNSHPELLKYTDYIGDWEKVKLNSKVYPYNSTLFITFYNMLKVDKDISYNGFVPLNRTMSKQEFISSKTKIDAEARNELKKSIKYDSLAIALYDGFMKRANQHHINTFVIVSPTIYRNSFNQEAIKKLKKLSEKYEMITFLDFSRKSEFNNNYELFSDVFHLNAKGAKIFTNEFTSYLIALKK